MGGCSSRLLEQRAKRGNWDVKYGRALALLIAMVAGLLHFGACAANESGSVGNAPKYAVVDRSDGAPADGQWDYGEPRSRA